MNNIKYRKVVDKYGEYYLPDFDDEYEDTEDEIRIGKYGLMRIEYLKNHRKGRYISLLTSGELRNHLGEIESEAESFLKSVIPQMMASQGVTEELKATDQMKWVALMSSIIHSVEETIIAEIIYD